MQDFPTIDNDVLIEPSMQDEFYFQWHITERCNWRCRHCYHETYEEHNELGSKELLAILARMEKALLGWGKKAAVSITGGEPWLRKDDVLAILQRMSTSECFSRADILTNGSLLNEEDCKLLRQHPILRRVQVSLEGSTPESNDKIRGFGTFDKTISAIRLMKANGLEVSVMMTLAEYNRDEVIPLLELLSDENVDAFALERFMPTGQSRKQLEQVLTPAHVQQTFDKVHQWALANRAPRVLQYRPLFCLLANDDPHVGAMCSVGENALTIMHDGTILPCRRLPLPLGNIMSDNLFQIWAESPLLWRVRTPSGLKGKCGGCDYIAQCRGCRAMAYAVTGDWLAPDPHCWHEVTAPPPHGPQLREEIRLVWPQGTNIRFAYSTETGVTIELNETSFRALKLMDGKRSVQDLAVQTATCEQHHNELTEDLEVLCHDLREMGFLAD